MTDDYDYEKELTSSSLSSASEVSSRTPKPPKKSKNDSSNLYYRQRIYKNYAESNNKVSFDRNDSIDESSIHPNDDIIKIIHTTPTASRLSRYSALPKIGNKTGNSEGNSPISRPTSVISNFEFDYNDLYDEDAHTLLGLRLPDGSKKQKTFNSNAKLQDVLNFGLNEMEVENYTDFSSFTLLEMPNNVINDLEQTIRSANIKERSMLFIIKKG